MVDTRFSKLSEFFVKQMVSFGRKSFAFCPGEHMSVRRAAVHLSIGLIVLSGCGKQVPLSQADRNALTVMEHACVEAMLKSTCSVMTGPQATEAAEVVFVAGVGAVDANAYRELRASGEAMCSVIRQSCEKDWEGGACRTARSLWPPASSPAQ